MYDLTGHSQLFDRIREQMLNNSYDFVATPERVEIKIGGTDPDEEKATFVVTRASSVSLFNNLLDVITEQGRGKDPLAGPPVAKRASWRPCPECNRLGYDRDNEGNHLVCDACGGRGILTEW
jgi:hypothetical protein